MRVNFKTSGYVVYYLPEHNYIGMTNNLQKRLWTHNYAGKIVEGWEVVADGFDCPMKAHQMEHTLHMMGYEGFQYIG